METDSSSDRTSYRRLATLAVVLSIALVPLSGLGAAQQAGAAGNQSHVAVQNGECTPISSFASNESAVEFYDYRLPATYSDNPYINTTGSAFGSEGTIEFQEPNTSIVFLYTDTNDTDTTDDDNTYLVFVHGAEANDNSTGGAATFDITGLPEDGNWTVRDDDYNDTTSTDNWNVTNTTSTVEWLWNDAATDGGVYSGIDDETNVTVEPAFNEDTEQFSENDTGTVEQWQVLSNNTTDDTITRTDLDLNESLQIAAGTCDDVADGAADTGDDETETPEDDETETPEDDETETPEDDETETPEDDETETPEDDGDSGGPVVPPAE